jgi:hypothetical protein
VRTKIKMDPSAHDSLAHLPTHLVEVSPRNLLCGLCNPDPRSCEVALLTRAYRGDVSLSAFTNVVFLLPLIVAFPLVSRWRADRHSVERFKSYAYKVAPTLYAAVVLLFGVDLATPFTSFIEVTPERRTIYFIFHGIRLTHDATRLVYRLLTSIFFKTLPATCRLRIDAFFRPTRGLPRTHKVIDLAVPEQVPFPKRDNYVGDFVLDNSVLVRREPRGIVNRIFPGAGHKPTPLVNAMFNDRVDNLWKNYVEVLDEVWEDNVLGTVEWVDRAGSYPKDRVWVATTDRVHLFVRDSGSRRLVYTAIYDRSNILMEDFTVRPGADASEVVYEEYRDTTKITVRSCPLPPSVGHVYKRVRGDANVWECYSRGGDGSELLGNVRLVEWRGDRAVVQMVETGDEELTPGVYQTNSTLKGSPRVWSHLEDAPVCENYVSFAPKEVVDNVTVREFELLPVAEIEFDAAAVISSVEAPPLGAELMPRSDVVADEMTITYDEHGRIPADEPIIPDDDELGRINRFVGILNVRTGGGKTFTMVRLAERRLREGTGRVAVIAPRIALVDEIVSKLRVRLGDDFTVCNYQTAEDPDRADVIVTTPYSAAKVFTRQGSKPRTVMFDEWRATVAELAGSFHERRYVQTWATLADLVSHANVLLFADASYDRFAHTYGLRRLDIDRIIDLNNRAPTQVTRIRCVHPPGRQGADRLIEFHCGREIGFDDIICDLHNGLRVAVFFASHAVLHSFRARLSQEGEDWVVKQFTSSDKELLIDAPDVDTAVRDCNVFVYTTAAGLGIDISETAFDNVYAFYSPNISVEQHAQALNRTRRVNGSRKIYYGHSCRDHFATSSDTADALENAGAAYRRYMSEAVGGLDYSQRLEAAIIRGTESADKRFGLGRLAGVMREHELGERFAVYTYDAKGADISSARRDRLWRQLSVSLEHIDTGHVTGVRETFSHRENSILFSSPLFVSYMRCGGLQRVLKLCGILWAYHHPPSEDDDNWLDEFVNVGLTHRIVPYEAFGVRTDHDKNRRRVSARDAAYFLHQKLALVGAYLRSVGLDEAVDCSDVMTQPIGSNYARALIGDAAARVPHTFGAVARAVGVRLNERNAVAFLRDLTGLFGVDADGHRYTRIRDPALWSAFQALRLSGDPSLRSLEVQTSRLPFSVQHLDAWWATASIERQLLSDRPDGQTAAETVSAFIETYVNTPFPHLTPSVLSSIKQPRPLQFDSELAERVHQGAAALGDATPDDIRSALASRHYEAVDDDHTSTHREFQPAALPADAAPRPTDRLGAVPRLGRVDRAGLVVEMSDDDADGGGYNELPNGCW